MKNEKIDLSSFDLVFTACSVLGRLYVRDKVTDHNLWRERGAEADSNRGPSAYQPNASPLGQTGSQEGAWLFNDWQVRRILHWTQDSAGCQCRVWRVGDTWSDLAERQLRRKALFWSLQIRIVGHPARSELQYSMRDGMEVQRRFLRASWVGQCRTELNLTCIGYVRLDIEFGQERHLISGQK